jgi:hypothetical protein
MYPMEALVEAIAAFDATDAAVAGIGELNLDKLEPLSDSIPWRDRRPLGPDADCGGPGRHRGSGERGSRRYRRPGSAEGGFTFFRDNTN